MHAYMPYKQTDRQTETDRDTDRHTVRHTHTETDKDTDRQTVSQSARQAGRKTDIQRCRPCVIMILLFFAGFIPKPVERFEMHTMDTHTHT
jgi:hypothetical protein